MACERLPESGRHEPPDEYVDDEQCSITEAHTDHYWSIEGHEHQDEFRECCRYCQGVEG